MRNRNLASLVLLALVAAVMPFMARSAAAFQINTTGRPVAAAVAYANRFDSYLAVWSEDRNTGTGQDLYAARLTKSGIVVGTDVPLVVAPGNQSDPALVFSPRVNQFLVVYTNDAGPGSPAGAPTPGLPQPLGGILNQDGAAGTDSLAQPTLPIPGPTSTPGGPPPPGAPGSRDIWGVWASPSGYRVSQTFALVSSPADDTFPDLANYNTSSGEQVVMAWREVTDTEVTISAQSYVGAFGYFLIIDGRKVLVASGGDKGKPTIAAEIAKSELLVAWAETPEGGTNRDIVARRMNSNAFPYGAVLKLFTGDTDDLNPSLASFEAEGGYLVAWESREQNMAPDIRTRRLNRNGIPVAPVNTLAGGDAYSFLPDIPSVSRNTGLILWLDRNAASDHSIVAREVNRDGRPLAPRRLVVIGGTGPDGPSTPAAPLPTP